MALSLGYNLNIKHWSASCSMFCLFLIRPTGSEQIVIVTCLFSFSNLIFRSCSTTVFWSTCSLSCSLYCFWFQPWLWCWMEQILYVLRTEKAILALWPWVSTAREAAVKEQLVCWDSGFCCVEGNYGSTPAAPWHSTPEKRCIVEMSGGLLLLEYCRKCV